MAEITADRELELLRKIEALVIERERLRALLGQACRQWNMYANLQEDRDIATEQSVEGALFRKCSAFQQKTKMEE